MLVCRPIYPLAGSIPVTSALFNMMKITIQTEFGTVTTDRDVCQIEDVVEMFKGLLVSAGYHPHAVDQHVITDDTWFQDKSDESSCASSQQTL